MGKLVAGEQGPDLPGVGIVNGQAHPAVTADFPGNRNHIGDDAGVTKQFLGLHDVVDGREGQQHGDLRAGC